tara:strand:- start:388 stop:561 length:174 start_codon:yes stop_codon:yes gene_type:complete
MSDKDLDSNVTVLANELPGPLLTNCWLTNNILEGYRKEDDIIDCDTPFLTCWSEDED